MNLGALSPQELVCFLVGYVADVSAFAHVNLWHDCHMGNLLMHREPSQDDPIFYWHDFGGVSSSTHSPRPQVLGEFARKIKETISEIEKAAHASIPGFPLIPKLVFDGSHAEHLQMHLRSYTVDVHNRVIGWSGDEKLRREALLSLHRVLSRSRYYALELILAEGDSS